MAVNLNETPAGSRLHIGIFGKTNSGKSTFLNAFTGQEVSIVADVAGTTTDPIYKAMEVHPIGPCVLIDTAGFDDAGALGEQRLERTRLAAEKTELAILLIAAGDEELDEELRWYRFFRERRTPVLFAVNTKGPDAAVSELFARLKRETGEDAVAVNAGTGEGMAAVREALVRLLPEDYGARSITGELVREGDLVLLVMPQDIQAPKGRLILPQVQTIRELLDRKCLVMSVTTDRLASALEALRRPPRLIITDSQAFGYVYERKPKESMLTSFSVLFAAYKGDLPYYLEGAKAIDALTEDSRVLIAECCTHAPLSEDIGREKLPRMLRKRVGERLSVTNVSGTDFPQELSGYDLVIQCGACMFNRRYVLSRVERARDQGVPMTNYGVAIAHLTGILDQISYGGIASVPGNATARSSARPDSDRSLSPPCGSRRPAAFR